MGAPRGPQVNAPKATDGRDAMAKKPSDTVTMRVKIGESELEVTGPRAFVQDQIKQFRAEHKQAGRAPGPKAGRGRKERRGQKPPAADSVPGAVDIMPIVNKLKERNDFTLIQERLLNKRDVWNRIRLILLDAPGPMTSGEIAKVFGGLGLRPHLPTISTKLKKNSASLLNSVPRKSGAHPRYSLSRPARSAAEKWLNEVLK